MRDFWSELIESEPDSLGIGFAKKAELQPVSCWIEVTLNYPRTPRFVNSSSLKQKKHYDVLFKEILYALGAHRMTSYKRTFEFCKSGHVHLHALVWYDHDPQTTPVGVLHDLVVSYLNTLPKRYRLYRDHRMCGRLLRYSVPSILVQYRRPDETERLHYWTDYIQKAQNKVFDDSLDNIE